MRPAGQAAVGDPATAALPYWPHVSPRRLPWLRRLAHLRCLRLWRLHELHYGGKILPHLADVPFDETTQECLRELLEQRTAILAETNDYFAPFHRTICAECKGQCCEPQTYFRHTPSEGALLGGALPETHVDQRFRDGVLRYALERFRRARRPHAGPPAEKLECPHLGQGGCVLPLSQRPSFCVIYHCPAIWSSMSWQDIRFLCRQGRRLGAITRRVLRCLRRSKRPSDAR